MGCSLLVALLLGTALDARVCLEERVPPEIARRLGGYLRTLKIHTPCGGEISRVRLTKTKLILERPDGTARRRALPWRLDPGAPLRSAARRGRLSELAVMIEALALEPVAGLLPPPAPAPRPVKRRRRRPTAPPPAPVAARVEPEAPAPEPQPPMLPGASGVVSAARAPAVQRSRYEIGVQSWLRYRTPGVATIELGVEVEHEGWFLRGSGAPTATWALDGRPIRLTSFGATGGYRGRLGLGSSVDLTWSAGIAAETLLVARTDVDAAATHATVDAGAAAGVGAAVRPFDGLSIALFAEGLGFPTAREVSVPEGPSARVNRWGARAGVEVAIVFDVQRRSPKGGSWFREAKPAPDGRSAVKRTTRVEDQNPRRETSAW